MQSNDFCHLHLHTEYSTLDGINRVNTLPKYIASIGQDACAITDHGNLAGIFKFWKQCKEDKIKPILGMEAYYCFNRKLREKDELDNSYYHLVLLAQNNVGLKNLIKLSSFAYTEGYYHHPRLDDELLATYNEGIIATSACLGSRASQLILNNRSEEAEAIITHHAQMFKDRFFVEIQLHDGEQQLVNEALVKIANKHNLPLILTGDCHYTESEDKDLHEITLAMQTRTTLSDPKRMSFGPIDVHVSSTDQLLASVRKLGLPEEAISNTKHLSKLIASDYFKDISNRYPKFMSLPEGHTSDTYLRELSYSCLAKKMGAIPSEYSARLNEELIAIKKMGFSDYMLIVWQFYALAESIDVWSGWGRGSAAGSLVSYSLGITKVDPIKHELLFSRFLNMGRGQTPVIFDVGSIDELETRKRLELPKGLCRLLHSPH